MMTKENKLGMLKKVRIPMILYILILMIILFSVMTDRFLSINNFYNIIRQGAALLVVSLGMTVVISSGGIDLSVASMVGLAGTMIAALLSAGWPLWATLIVTLLASAVLGVLTGVLVGYAKIFPFIVTFSMLYIVRSLSLGVTMGGSLHIEHRGFIDFSNQLILGAPSALWISIVCIVIVWFIYRKTPFGAHCYAIGTNQENAKFLGVNVPKITILGYILSAVLACVGGIIYAGRLATGNALVAEGLEFECIAAVVIGGTPIAGGRGTLVGSVLGALLITVLRNGLTLLGCSSELTAAIMGAAIMVAVILVQTLHAKR